MNVRRFIGRNAREAMAQARAAFGDQALVVANRPVPGGVEVLALASGDVPAAAPAAAAPGAAQEAPVMSTFSFKDFVRERQRQDAAAQAGAPAAARAPARAVPPTQPARFAAEAIERELGPAAVPASADVIAELRRMRGMIASQLASMAWFDGVRRDPQRTRLLRLMIGNGFSPALARTVIERLPDGRSDAQAEAWLLDVVARNLRCVEADGVVDRGGVFALVGPTGVGKTTTTAKLAAHHAMRHGAASVGLITVDTYRMAAGDQLRAFARLLGIPVHTAGDPDSLQELLGLLAGRRLVLIDTVGIGQRDRRLAGLLNALPAQVARLLVLNAAAQGETLDEAAQAWSAGPGTRCVFTKLDEAAKCAGVVDVAVRHRLLVEGFCNGQRVPEDWHAPRARLLAQKALLKTARTAFEPDDSELGLLLAAPAHAPRQGEVLHA